jgi:hypothetical protein
MIATIFQEEFQNMGFATEVGDDRLTIIPLGLALHLEHLYTEDYTSCFKISAQHLLFPEGRHELLFGGGHNERDRYVDAARRWLNVDFPVLHAYLCPGNNDGGVQRAEIVTQTGDVQTGWNLLLGPVLIMEEGSTRVENKEIWEFYKLLANEMTTVMDTPGLLWVKCFTGKFSTGRVDVSCRLNGEHWESAVQELHQYTQETQISGSFQMLHQFMLLYPRPLNELSSRDELSRRVSDEHRKHEQKPDKWSAAVNAVTRLLRGL